MNSQCCASSEHRKNQAGFTLIEIVIAIGILASLSLYAVTALTNQIETRNKLQQSNEVIHAAHAAMMRLTDDIRHAYMLSGNEEQAALSNSDRVGRPMFVLKDVPRLLLMTQAHQSLIANKPESNLAYAQYVVCPDPSAPSEVCKDRDSYNGPKQLVRVVDPTITKVADDSFISGVSQVLVNDLKELKLKAWNGQDFLTDWNTERSDFGKKLPKMVKIELSVFMPKSSSFMALPEDENAASERDRPSLTLSTIVYLMYTAGQADLKEAKAEPGWVQ
jgi:prepilin-type N-terminal cleavage/methylation domain-containing protein